MVLAYHLLLNKFFFLSDGLINFYASKKLKYLPLETPVPHFYSRINGAFRLWNFVSRRNSSPQLHRLGELGLCWWEGVYLVGQKPEDERRDIQTGC